MNNVPQIQGEPLTPLDDFWLGVSQTVVTESISAIEEAAKQLIAMTTLAQTIYFAAISFSDLKKSMELMTVPQQWPVVFVLAFPLILWVISLALAIRVFIPRAYHTNLISPDLACKAYYKIVAYKHQQLRRAHILLVGGFVPVVINIFIYLMLVPAPPAK